MCCCETVVLSAGSVCGRARESRSEQGAGELKRGGVLANVRGRRDDRLSVAARLRRGEAEGGAAGEERILRSARGVSFGKIAPADAGLRTTGFRLAIDRTGLPRDAATPARNFSSRRGSGRLVARERPPLGLLHYAAETNDNASALVSPGAGGGREDLIDRGPGRRRRSSSSTSAPLPV